MFLVLTPRNNNEYKLALQGKTQSGKLKTSDMTNPHLIISVLQDVVRFSRILPEFN